MADLKRLFIGKPLKSAENDEHKLSRFAALALLSSDALSSICLLYTSDAADERVRV